MVICTGMSAIRLPPRRQTGVVTPSAPACLDRTGFDALLTPFLLVPSGTRRAPAGIDAAATTLCWSDGRRKAVWEYFCWLNTLQAEREVFVRKDGVIDRNGEAHGFGAARVKSGFMGFL
jgi:hypothetical protein